MRHGKGKYSWPYGDVYNGDFVSNKRTGHGSFVNATAMQIPIKSFRKTGRQKFRECFFAYEGDFKNGEPYGKGQIDFRLDHNEFWTIGGLSFSGSFDEWSDGILVTDEKNDKDYTWHGNVKGFMPTGHGYLEKCDNDKALKQIIGQIDHNMTLTSAHVEYLDSEEESESTFYGTIRSDDEWDCDQGAYFYLQNKLAAGSFYPYDDPPVDDYMPIRQDPETGKKYGGGMKDGVIIDLTSGEGYLIKNGKKTPIGAKK
jgi:hypothetical protein